MPTHVTLDLTAIDSAVAEMGEPVLIAAMAMRKLQALHLLSTPGVKTTTDVVVSIVQDLQRALMQAPSMHLRRAAASADWDTALAEIGDLGEAPGATDDRDLAVERFRQLHALLVVAVEAVIEASDGEVRVLV